MTANQHDDVSIKVTASDVDVCGWKDIVSQLNKPGYLALKHAFQEAAHRAQYPSHEQALRLLSDACALTLNPESKSAPFRSTTLRNGFDTITPASFSYEEQVFIAQVAEATDHPWLKARLTDLLWVIVSGRTTVGGRRRHEWALLAIESYLQIPISKEAWCHGASTCWQRIVTLSAGPGRGKPGLEEVIIEQLLQAFHGSDKSIWNIARDVAEQLERLDLPEAAPLEIATKLNELANAFDGPQQVDATVAGVLFWQTAKWFNIAKNPGRAAEIKLNRAECYVREAKANPAAAGYFYHLAIMGYYSVDRSQILINVEARIQELRAEMDARGRQSMLRVTEIPIPSIYIGDLVAQSQQAVSGKPSHDALLALATLFPLPSYAVWRKEVIAELRALSLTASLPITMFNPEDGRVVAQRPALAGDPEPTDGQNPEQAKDARWQKPSEKDEEVVHWEMVQMFRHYAHKCVEGHILPALEVLLLEQQLGEADFIHLTSQSPIVPPTRARAFGKSLFAGYDHDFLTSIHLLAPQVEHLVRYWLTPHQVATTSLQPNGTETENALGSLLSRPNAKELLGEDLHFALRALFSDPCGANLRNNIAHGLLDDEQCQSIDTVFAWWLVFQLVYRHYWEASKPR